MSGTRVAREGDIIEGICDHDDICCPHFVTGRFVEASGNTYAQGKGIIREGDMCRTTCPHCGIGWAHGHSDTCYVNGRPVHRMGDSVRLGGGWGQTVEASPNLHANT